MSVSAAHTASFRKEAYLHGVIWGIRDAEGFPAPRNPDGEERAMPFWPLESRALRVIETVPAYAGFETVELRLEDFTTRWLPGLETDGLLVGLNWSGARATGYDCRPSELMAVLADTQ